MFRPVQVGLQRQRRAGVDVDPLDLEAVAAADRLIPAPGPVIAGKGGGLRRPARLQRLDRQAHRLGRACIGHQHRIAGRDGDDVRQPDPDQFHPVVVRPQKRALAVDAPSHGPEARCPGRS